VDVWNGLGGIVHSKPDLASGPANEITSQITAPPRRLWRVSTILRHSFKILSDTGVKSVKIPPRSPNLNAHAERFVRTIKESCLERLIFGERSVRRAAVEFRTHYHGERNHQGLNNKLISPDPKHVREG
jgi:hypothetical protein